MCRLVEVVDVHHFDIAHVTLVSRVIVLKQKPFLLISAIFCIRECFSFLLFIINLLILCEMFKKLYLNYKWKFVTRFSYWERSEILFLLLSCVCFFFFYKTSHIDIWHSAIVREVRCKGRGEWKSILTAHYSTALLQYKSTPARHPVACQTL